MDGERDRWYSDCFCGSKKEQFSNDYGDKYCCVHQNSPNDCIIDTNGKWCPNATLLSKNHICNKNCYSSDMVICPSNPEACMNFDYECDGRERCEAFCAGPLENFPYYNQTAKKCQYIWLDYPYCGIREEAKYHNHQCNSYLATYVTDRTEHSGFLEH